MQLSIKDRDAEIKRLADKVESGTETDMSALEARNESNEAIILSLNEQVCLPSFQTSCHVSVCTPHTAWPPKLHPDASNM